MVCLGLKGFLDKISSKPIPWDGRILLEVGFGGGELLPEIAKTYGATEVIGVETSAKAMEEAKRRIGSAKGITIVRSDARFFVKYMIPPNSLYGVLTVFPDPFIKHEKKRVVDRRFLEDIAEKLKPGGFFLFVTDWKDYYLQVADAAKNIGCFKEGSIKEPEINTRFKRRWERKGRKFCKISLIKTEPTEHPKWPGYPKKDIKIQITASAEPRPFVLKKNGYIFKVERVFRGKDGYLMRTLVKTPDGIEMKQLLRVTTSTLETVSTGHEAFPEPVEELMKVIKEDINGRKCHT